MSYSFVVESLPGGTVQLASAPTGDVPPGKFQVSGHEDDSNRSLAVTRFTETGLVAAQAAASTRKDA